MADNFDHQITALHSPARRAVAVSIDPADIAEVPRAFHALSTGTITVIFAGDDDSDSVTIPVVQGQFYPYRIRRFTAAVPAAQIIALY